MEWNTRDKTCGINHVRIRGCKDVLFSIKLWLWSSLFRFFRLSSWGDYYMCLFSVSDESLSPALFCCCFSFNPFPFSCSWLLKKRHWLALSKKKQTRWNNTRHLGPNNLCNLYSLLSGDKWKRLFSKEIYHVRDEWKAGREEEKDWATDAMVDRRDT